jgi:hypothetical protein
VRKSPLTVPQTCSSQPQARPIYHRKRDSIEAHLTIVFAALAVSRWIEAQTSWSVRKFLKTARRYRTIQIQAGRQTITAAHPFPDDLRHALQAVNRAAQVRASPRRAQAAGSCRGRCAGG